MYVDISEEIFEAMLDSLDGDYIIEAQVLASMKPRLVMLDWRPLTKQESVKPKN